MLYYFSGGFEIIIFTLLETAFDSGHFLGLSLHQVMLRYIGFKRGEKTAILPVLNIGIYDCCIFHVATRLHLIEERPSHLIRGCV